MTVSAIPKKPLIETLPTNALTMVDVRDTDGHLLFKYDSLTNTIEIKSRGRVFCVGVDQLRYTGKRNVLEEVPTTSVEVKGDVEPQ